MSKRIIIEIEMDNDAFVETPMSEVARILRDIAKRGEKYGMERWNSIHDSNGNRCGTIRVVTQ